MNKERRTRLKSLHETLTAVQSELMEIKEEEEAALANLPDSLQDAKVGQGIQEAIEKLEEVESDMDSIVDALNDLTAAA